MSSADIHLTAPAAKGPLPSSAVRRTAFYFGSPPQSLFAWLHLPDGAAATSNGVIVCPPLGHEQVHSHRTLRHLADALAAARFPVLRFDYAGTGDSCGSGEEPNRHATWLANIREAILWMKNQVGCRRITLVGLRLGAALATQVAAEGGVDDLLLWAPVVKGRSYVRELKALSNSAPDDADAKQPSDGIEAAGFVVATQTLQDLSNIDLLQTRPQCGRSLIIVRDDMPADILLLEHFKTCAIDVQQTVQPGYADMMAEPHFTKVPHEAIACAVAWARAGVSAEDETINIDPDRFSAASVMLCSASNDSTESAVCERLVSINQQLRLFGIISEIPGQSPQHLPFIVLLNAGSAYHAGPNRLYVFLARQLAARGFRCLRIDLSGLGDSAPLFADHDNETYPATAFRDIELTLQYLRIHLGAERAMLMGLCSGAYNAFQTAAQSANRMLVESLLINPLTFFWREGMSLTVTPAEQLKSYRRCLHSASQWAKWWKLLTGRSKLGISGAVRVVMERWRLAQPPGHSAPTCKCGARSDGFPTHPVAEDLPGDLERIAQADRYVACFFSRFEPGYGLLMLHAKRKTMELCQSGRMRTYFLDTADHTLTRRADRIALAKAIIDHLGQRYLTPPITPVPRQASVSTPADDVQN